MTVHLYPKLYAAGEPNPPSLPDRVIQNVGGVTTHTA